MIRLCIILYLLGLLFFYLMTFNKVELPSTIYYIWDKTAGSGVLFWIAIDFHLPQYHKIIRPVILLSLGRLLLEFVIIAVNIPPSYDWAIVLLFFIWTAATSAICLYNGSKRDEFLKKYTP